MVKIDTLVSKMRAVGFMHAQANIEKTLSLASDNDLSHIELLANALDDEISQRNAARIEKNKNNQILIIQKQLRSLILKRKHQLLSEKSMTW